MSKGDELWKDFHESSSDANEQINRLGRMMPFALSIVEEGLDSNNELAKIQAASAILTNFSRLLILGVEFKENEKIVFHIFDHFSKCMSKALDVYDELMNLEEDDQVRLSAAYKLMDNWSSWIVVEDDGEDVGE
jgi:hypothetical protein